MTFSPLGEVASVAITDTINTSVVSVVITISPNPAGVACERTIAEQVNFDKQTQLECVLKHEST